MAPADTVVCRRSPHLACYWRGPEFLVHNYATGVLVSADPLTCGVLDFFDDWRSIDAFLSTRPQTSRRLLRTLLHRLVAHTLLQRSTQPLPAERAMDRWARWNPAAGLFHTATKDVPFIDMAAQVKSLRAKTKTAPMPRQVKRYPRATQVPLPPQTGTSEFPSVLLARRTWRRFSAAPIDRASFGTLMGLTAGIQRWAHAAGEGKVALKTSPSGGARHAIELYTLARRVRGVPPGLYHYAADVQGLELIESGLTGRLVGRYLPRQPWFAGAAAVVFFAAVFERELWRYGYARAYRALLIEAGHLCQTFCLTATWLGLAPFCTMALADSAIERDLGLDGIGESVLYAAGIGARPDGVRPPSARATAATQLNRSELKSFPGRISKRSR